MARARNLKPGFFTNDVLAECAPLARILFEGLWCHADRAGRLEDRPKKIKAGILPYDECDIEDLLEQLASRGFIERYCVEGVNYIQVVEFKKHQNPHKDEKASVIPASKLHSATTTQEQNENSSNPALTLIPDSLIPDPLNKDIVASRQLDYAEDFEDAYREFPSRPGSSKKKAFAAWKARLKAGVSVEEMTAGVRRYAAYIAAMKTEPQFIQMPATFFGPSENFRSNWVIPDQVRGSPSGRPEKFDPVAHVNRNRVTP